MLEKEINSIYINTQYDTVKIFGKDSVDLIQRISTNDVKGVKENEFQTTLFLTDKGKLVDAYQFIKKDDVFIGITASYDSLNEWVDKYVFVEDVSIERADYTYCDVILGENIISLFGTNLKPGEVNIIPVLDHEIIAFVEYSNHVKILVPNDILDKLVALDEFKQISKETYTQWRINSFVGSFPNEYNDTLIPLEVGLVDHISFTKGCYIGQEIVARLDSYQKVTKYLVQVKTQQELNADKQYTLTNENGKKLGVLTTIGTFDQEGFYHLGIAHKSICNQNEPILVEENDSSKQIEATVDDILDNKTYYVP